MGTREIKTPEDVPETSTSLGGNSDSFRRKKLGIYFTESDDRRAISGGYTTGGTTPVNIRGKPISELSKTGGWIAAFFIFGNKLMFLKSACFLCYLQKQTCEPQRYFHVSVFQIF